MYHCLVHVLVYVHINFYSRSLPWKQTSEHAAHACVPMYMCSLHNNTCGQHAAATRTFLCDCDKFVAIIILANTNHCLGVNVC